MEQRLLLFMIVKYGLQAHLYAYTHTHTHGREERQKYTNALAFDILRSLGGPDGGTTHITSRVWEQCV